MIRGDRRSVDDAVREIDRRLKIAQVWLCIAGIGAAVSLAARVILHCL